MEIQAKLAKEHKEAEVKKLKDIQKLESLKLDIEMRTFTIPVKVGNKGQVFSGVHDKDVIEAVNKKMGLNLDRHAVELPKPIKELGEHKVKIKIGPGMSAGINIKIDPLNP